MPAAEPQLPSKPLCLVFGDEDFLVRDRARQVYDGWCAEVGGEDHEIIDGTVRNAAEALDALAKLNEAVQTLPFFGGAKVVWLRDTNFLGDERTASSRDVTDRLNGLAKGWETFDWQGVRVLISAGKVDKRKTFFKTARKIGAVEDLSVAEKERGSRAALIVRQRLAELGKKIAVHVADELVLLAGTNLQQLHSEADKLAAFVGERGEVTRQDVHAIATRTRQARAFALADALGERNLPKLLRVLDEELWEVKLDSKKSPIALLYGLISKVRTMIFLRELLRLKWIRAGGGYPQFKSQLEAIPDDRLPGDRKFNPKAMHPYMLFNALGHARQYSEAELTKAMDILLRCNRQLVSSSTDDTLLLQQAVVQIVSKAA
ncbi:MAG: DNA polymerase III subunit delta [Verrucomicrobiota bacterium]|nr:DNA polymerase III subunit delta [Verrucomicrobiota bacterium]